MTNEKSLNELKKRTAWLSIGSNSALVVLKLFVGLYAGSVSLISEAMHSGVDLLAAMIAFFAVKKSVEPPDAEHAYGHGKFENLSGAIEALLIVFAAILIIYEAVEKFSTAQQPEYLEYGIAIMLVSIFVNYVVSKRLIAVARQTDSQALEADGLHLQADIWTSVGVLLGLAAIKLTGWAWLDPVIAILVASIIFKAGWDMTVASTKELTDVSLPAEDEAIIKYIINSHADIVNCHRLRTRRSGAYRILDVHVVMDGRLPLKKAHDVCDDIERQIREKLGMCDVMIHAEPNDESSR